MRSPFGIKIPRIRDGLLVARNAAFGHRLDVEIFVELLFGQEAHFLDDRPHALALFRRLLGDLAGLVVADGCVEGRSDRGVQLQLLLAPLTVGLNAFDALGPEGLDAAGEDIDAL